MALFIKQQEQRTELQERIAAELQEKARRKAAAGDRPDGIDDSAFVKGTKRTTTLAWVWGIIVMFAVAAIVGLIVRSVLA